MKPSVIAFAATSIIFMSAVKAHTTECASLRNQSQQIACLELQIELLRSELKSVRVNDAALRQLIDDRIKFKLENAEAQVRPIWR